MSPAPHASCGSVAKRLQSTYHVRMASTTHTCHQRWLAPMPYSASLGRPHRSGNRRTKKTAKPKPSGGGGGEGEGRGESRGDG